MGRSEQGEGSVRGEGGERAQKRGPSLWGEGRVTLIELVLIAAIIGVLVALALPA